MNLREKLVANKFVVTAELNPPKTLNLEKILLVVSEFNLAWSVQRLAYSLFRA